MSIATLTYHPPIRRDAVGTELDYELLELANQQFDSGDFLAATATVLRHLFPDGEPPDLSQPFSFTQGSSQVTARIDDGVCFLSVPMVRLNPAGGGVAALRYVLQRINSSGQLHQARLRGEDVYLEYSEKVSALHPSKLIEVLRRMPVVADQHDDWMESQFGVTPLDRGPMVPLDPADLALAAQFWPIHWNDVEELLKEAQRKRSQWFLNEVTSFALQRARFTLPLAGKVLPRLLESAGTFNDCDVDQRKRETALAKCIKDMRALTDDELRASLGHVVYAINPHNEGTPARLSGMIGPGNYIETVARFQHGGHSIEAAISMIGTYYYLLSTHSWPAEVSGALKAGLIATSGKPWREAAGLLLDHAAELVEQYTDDDDDEAEDDEPAQADAEVQ